MIITKHGDHLRLVRQYDHGLQAGGVTERLGNKTFDKAPQSLVTAVREHDLGWKNHDERVMFDAKQNKPTNFIDVNVKEHVQLYREGYKTIVKQDLRAGLLIGMHWIGLYTKRYGYDPTFTYNVSKDLVSFMKSTISETEKEWVDVKADLWIQDEQSRNKFEDELWKEYEMIQVMDRISLFISMHEPEEEGEVNLGPVRPSLISEPVYLTVKSLRNGDVSVDPFPFDDVVETVVTCRNIPDRPYKSHGDLVQTLKDVEEEKISYRYVPVK